MAELLQGLGLPPHVPDAEGEPAVAAEGVEVAFPHPHVGPLHGDDEGNAPGLGRGPHAFPSEEGAVGLPGADGAEDPARGVNEGAEPVPLVVHPGPLPEEDGKGHQGLGRLRGPLGHEAEDSLLRVEGEGEEGVRPFPVQDARPHHLPQGEAEGEGKGPGAHLQDPGAPMGVDQLQDLGQGDGLQVSFQKYPSPMPNTSVRPSGPR